MKPPLVSVIVPNYNHAPYLRKRLESILSQTFKDYEVIVLDDASTDASRDVLKPYQGRAGVQIVENSVNSGSPFKQWNKGVALAKGKYLWIAESDDWAANTFLERTVDIMERHPEVGLTYCQSWIVDADEKVVGLWIETLPERERSHWQSDFIRKGVDECRDYLVERNVIPNASAILLRSDVYMQVGGADESFRLCGDWAMWVRMLCASDNAHISAPLNFYRRHPETQRMRLPTLNNPVAIEEQYRILKLVIDKARPAPKIARRALDRLLFAFDERRSNIKAESPDLYERMVRAMQNADPGWRLRRIRLWAESLHARLWRLKQAVIKGK
jgi:glycosyltransferase involved in cell wall biosynthesis